MKPTKNTADYSVAQTSIHASYSMYDPDVDIIAT